MKNHSNFWLIVLSVIMFVVRFSGLTATAAPLVVAGPGNESAGYQPGNQIALPGMPAVGKWLISPDGQIAHWLGYKIKGKALQEPINVILIDGVAKSAEEANARLLRSCTDAGYDNMLGHSSGYFGFIGEKLYGQYPATENRAFSNTFFWTANNHGRVLGPHYFAGKYYYVAAFSREDLDMNTDVKHVYRSFVVARDDFAKQLSANSTYQISGKVDLKNGIPNDPVHQTVGDHDGKAVVLEVVVERQQ
jgi:hypothetical protein